MDMDMDMESVLTGFDKERQDATAKMNDDLDFQVLSKEWLNRSLAHRYPYNFDWLGLPIIQYPQDIVAVQELVWRVKPSVIVETGVARGGSLVLSASLLSLLDFCFGAEASPGRRVLGVDIEIRPENREAIERHPLSEKIVLLEGSSISAPTFRKVSDQINNGEQTMVFLDSNHTYEHVYEELKLYSELVSAGSYLVVFDTVVESLSADALGDRPWGRGNSPMTAVDRFLSENKSFYVDKFFDSKLQVSVSPGGFLRKL